MVTVTNSSYRLISDHHFAAVWQNILNDQKAFFAQRRYQPGEVLAPFSANETRREPSYLTVQVGDDQHIMLQPEHLQYINHSCDPNVFFDTSLLQIVALKVIEAGDEMTFFYPSTEWEMAQPFQCTCGTKACLGQVRGAAHLPPAVLSGYRVSPYIVSRLAGQLVEHVR